MRYAPGAAAAVLMLAPSPASATAGLSCSPVSGEGPIVSLVIGHAVAGGIVGASLMEEGRLRSTMREGDGLTLAQAWIDRERIWVDLADPQGARLEGELRLRFATEARDRVLAGTFARNGRVYPVSCEES